MRDLVLSFAEKAADKVLGLRTYPESALERPKLIAHRGAWDCPNCPENTMAAFAKARDLGVWGIEFDVHFTRDQVPVINHDPDLFRLHGIRGTIQGMTADELKRSAPMVPTLEEVLSLKGVHFFPEIKTALTPRLLEVLAAHFRELEPITQYHLLALDPDLVRPTAKFPAPAWMLVGQVNLKSLVRISVQRGLGGVAGHYLGMTRMQLDFLRAAGQKAGVGFIPDKNLFNREWGRGVDFVFTNSSFAVTRAPRT